MRVFQLALRSRLYLGFGVLVALGLGMAGFGLLGLSGVSNTIVRMDTIAGNLVRIEEVARRFEVIEGAVNRYRGDGSAASLKDMREAEAQATDLIAEAIKVVLSEQRRALYNRISDSLRAGIAEREAFTRANDAGFIGRAKVLSGGPPMTAAATRLVDASEAGGDPVRSAAAEHLMSTVTAVRMVGLRYIAALQPADVTVFGTNVEKALTALAALDPLTRGDDASLIGPVRDALAGYTASFEQASTGLKQAADIADNKLLPRLEVMQKDAKTALDSLRETFQDNVAETTANAQRTMWLQIMVATAATVIGAVLAFLIARGIVRPVASMTEAMTRLARGDHQVEIPATDKTDEIGAMARAVEVFKQNAIENRRLTEANVKEQAARDRRQSAMDSHIQDFGTSISSVMAILGQSADRMRTAADGMSEAAKRTRVSTSGAVEGTNTSARDLGSVAVATEQMAASIGEISRQVSKVTDAVAMAVDRASETDKKVEGLSDTADRIGEVVRLITDIAGQNDLLALNATIEAARAGEAGKGFAVVASEVKTLATQTARATDQIGSQIVAIRASTSEAVEAMREVSTAIGEVAVVATAIAAAVEQQAAATREISESLQSVTQATNNSAQSMGQVLTIAEETDIAGQSVLSAADEVGRTAGTLRVEVNDFLSAMKQVDGEDRRAYERIPGGGATASLRIRGSNDVRAVVRNISLGGIALTCDCAAPPGTEVTVVLPPNASVVGRTVRSGDGAITIAFHQDAASLETLRKVLGAIEKGAMAAAA